MDHGVDEPFEPGVTGNDGPWLEPAGVVQRAAPVDQAVDLLTGLLDHLRYRPFNPDIGIVLYTQPRARTPLGVKVSNDADVGLRKECRRILAEQENGRVRQFTLIGQQAAGLEKVPDVTLRPSLRSVVLDQLGVQEIEAQAIRDREAVVLALPLVEFQLLSLPIVQPPRLVADPQVAVTVPQLVHPFPWINTNDEKLVRNAGLVDAFYLRESGAYRRRREIHRRLT